jgi:hypothetical protein
MDIQKLNCDRAWPSPGSDDDRRWFRARPHRKHRVRAAYPDEFPDDRVGLWTIVRQVRPGVRLRVVAELTGPPKPGEGDARRLFEQAASRYSLVARVAEALR